MGVGKIVSVHQSVSAHMSSMGIPLSTHSPFPYHHTYYKGAATERERERIKSISSNAGTLGGSVRKPDQLGNITA